MKIIIDNRVEGLSDLMALEYVSAVVAQGKISNDGKQYCYVTQVNDVIIYCLQNAKSFRFLMLRR